MQRPSEIRWNKLIRRSNPGCWLRLGTAEVRVRQEQGKASEVIQGGKKTRDTEETLKIQYYLPSKPSGGALRNFSAD